jgi:hypothetical protein
MINSKTGPKPKPENVVRKLLERWQNGQWTLVREARDSDFDQHGRLLASLRELGPTRTVSVREDEG